MFKTYLQEHYTLKIFLTHMDSDYKKIMFVWSYTG